MRGDDQTGASALIIAHPGHELRVYGWVARARPRVFVLTDGSGRSGRSRLATTTRILAELGAAPGGIYGRLTDRTLYKAILGRDPLLFTELIEELAAALGKDQTRLVAGDAIEGYNPGHDLCRVIIDGAVKLACLRSGRPIRNMAFPLTGSPVAAIGSSSAGTIEVELDQPSFDRKLAAARGYVELASSVEEAFRITGADAFRKERLIPVTDAGEDPSSDRPPPFEEPPFYEQYGERQVALGYYRAVLRYREHFLPLATSLRRHVEGQG